MPSLEEKKLKKSDFFFDKGLTKNKIFGTLKSENKERKRS